MTGRDLITFGKYGPKNPAGALSLEQIKTRHPDYVNWLCTQPDFATKNPALFAYFTKGEEAATEVERRNLEEGDKLLASMSPDFQAFWKRAYGERLRKLGEMNYLAYLRVAMYTWTECCKLHPATPLPPLDHVPSSSPDCDPQTGEPFF